MDMPAQMFRYLIMLLLALSLASVCGFAQHDKDKPRVVTITSAEALHALFQNRVDSVHVLLEAGEYTLSPAPYTDPMCGNCPPDRIDTPAETTVGLHIRGSNIRISGPMTGEAVLHTNAGYGLLIEDASQIHLERLTITGGSRSADPNATDGAVVVRRTDAVLHDCIIRDNIGDEDVVRRTVSGVMGIVGREDSSIEVSRCRILRNSWDGIALYRDAQATIEHVVVDGMERSVGATIGGGRGVGIGVTWNGRAVVRDTLIRRYWKGLGIFVDANVEGEYLIIEDIVTWGIALWDAGSGRPTAFLDNNIVYNTGACGISIAFRTEHENPGRLTGHAIVRSGQSEAYDAPDRYCRQCPIARASVPEGFRMDGILMHDNRRADCDESEDDLSDDAFRAAVAPLVEAMLTRSAHEGSSFLEKFSDREPGEPQDDRRGSSEADR